MMPTCSVASLTIAYNGARVLPKQLAALARQTRKIDKIIVVDNGSSDGTKDFLRREYPEVIVLDLKQNRGIAGGTSAGLCLATATDEHDWIWLLDQDSVPSDDGLERLFEGLDWLDGAAANVAIVASSCVDPETNLVWPPLLWRNGWRPLPANALSAPACFVDATIASGSMVRKETIKTIGLPREDFFMDFVDLEYCLRLRGHGYKIAIIRDSVVSHSVGIPRKVRLFGHSAVWRDHLPWRHYYMARNEVFTIWHYYPGWGPKSSVIHRLFDRATRVLLYGNHKLACLKMMFLGVIDGCKGRLGVRFLDTTP
jgi:GT2 family glycosyltransferase